MKWRSFSAPATKNEDAVSQKTKKPGSSLLQNEGTYI